MINPLDRTALDLLFVDFTMLKLDFTSERPPIVLEEEAFTFWRHLTTGARALVLIDFKARTIARFDQDLPTLPMDKPAALPVVRSNGVILAGGPGNTPILSTWPDRAPWKFPPEEDQ